MKKVLLLFFALILAAGAVSLAEDEIPDAVEVPEAGFRFAPPESFRDTAGRVALDGTYEIGEGVLLSSWMYYAMTKEEVTAWYSDHNSNAPAEYRIIPLFYVLSIGNGMTFKSFNAQNGNAIPAKYIREIGKHGDITYYLFMEGPNTDFLEVIDPAYRAEYTALAGAVDDIAAAFSFFDVQEKPDPYIGLVGSRFEFTTTDLDGNPVSSAVLFGQNQITMVNLWATWCGPCTAEMEDLQAIHARMQEKKSGVVGLLLDDDLETARRLMEENSITYPVVFAPETLNDFFSLESVPCTIFVGGDGLVLADPIIGAYPEKYEAALDSLLQE